MIDVDYFGKNALSVVSIKVGRLENRLHRVKSGPSRGRTKTKPGKQFWGLLSTGQRVGDRREVLTIGVSDSTVWKMAVKEA